MLPWAVGPSTFDQGTPHREVSWPAEDAGPRHCTSPLRGTENKTATASPTTRAGHCVRGSAAISPRRNEGLVAPVGLTPPCPRPAASEHTPWFDPVRQPLGTLPRVTSSYVFRGDDEQLENAAKVTP